MSLVDVYSVPVCPVQVYYCAFCAVFISLSLLVSSIRVCACVCFNQVLNSVFAYLFGSTGDLNMGIESWSSHMLGKHSIMKLDLQPSFTFLLKQGFIQLLRVTINSLPSLEKFLIRFLCLGLIRTGARVTLKGSISL